MILELARLLAWSVFAQFDKPLAFFFLPVAADDLGVEVHKLSQIMQMDQIYSGADLTIVAAAGDDKFYGLPGVSETPRIKKSSLQLLEGTVFSTGPDPCKHVSGHSPWSKRAWTFQEGVLSNRLLVFTDYQMSFYCQRTSWMEALGGPQYADQQVVDWDSWPVRTSLWDPDDLRGKPGEHLLEHPVEVFKTLVQQYSRRSLSYQDDALNAVFGVLKSLANRDDPVLSLGGLPYYHYNHDRPSRPVEHAMGIALSWKFCHNDVPPPRRKAFPSWTWAGWNGAMW